MKKNILIFVVTAFAALSCSRPEAIPQLTQTVQVPDGEIRSLYIELGHNMWCDWPTAQMLKDHTLEEACKMLPEAKRPDLKLICTDENWRTVTDYAAAKGLNMLVVDLGEGLFYPSHPELAIEGTWSVEKMQSEIKRLNGLGIEVVPKLNFSQTHNGWMKDWRHMVSSEPYYKFCEEVIHDAWEIFGKPRFFHIGYDEETWGHQGEFTYQCVRSDEAWWQDFLHTVGCVEKLGARPWVWSDYGWGHPEYFERCSKKIIMQNWFYDECAGGFDLEKNQTGDHAILAEYSALDAAGFDQVPCGTNWVGYGRRTLGMNADDVIGSLIEYSRATISKEHLLGFMMAPWAACDTDENVQLQLHAIDLFVEGLK